jgi:hypothetical protein
MTRAASMVLVLVALLALTLDFTAEQVVAPPPPEGKIRFLFEIKINYFFLITRAKKYI